MSPRSTERSLELINKDLVELRKKAYNPDSRFNVASIIRYRTSTGEIKYASGINTEMSMGIDTNVCAERNALAEARKDGADIKVLDVYVMGGHSDEKFDKDKIKHTPCCAICLDQLMQFSELNTELPNSANVHLIPLNNGKAPQSEMALKNVIIKSMGELIPPILRYDVADACRFLKKSRPKGIFSGNNPEEAMNNLLKSLSKLKSDSENTNKSELGMPPIHGEMTDWLKQLRNHTGREVNNHEFMHTILGMMRNERILWNNTDAKGHKIGRIESAIAVTEEGRFFCATTIFGDKISKQPQAASAAINQAHHAAGGIYKMTHLLIQGDPMMAGPNRMIPLLRELYLYTKRSIIHESTDGKMKLPGLQIIIYPPTVPGKKITTDTRDISERLQDCGKQDEIMTFRLDQLTGPMVFFAAKMQKHELDLPSFKNGKGR